MNEKNTKPEIEQYLKIPLYLLCAQTDKLNVYHKLIIANILSWQRAGKVCTFTNTSMAERISNTKGGMEKHLPALAKLPFIQMQVENRKTDEGYINKKTWKVDEALLKTWLLEESKTKSIDVTDDELATPEEMHEVIPPVEISQIVAVPLTQEILPTVSEKEIVPDGEMEEEETTLLVDMEFEVEQPIVKPEPVKSEFENHINSYEKLKTEMKHPIGTQSWEKEILDEIRFRGTPDEKHSWMTFVEIDMDNNRTQTKMEVTPSGKLVKDSFITMEMEPVVANVASQTALMLFNELVERNEICEIGSYVWKSAMMICLKRKTNVEHTDEVEVENMVKEIHKRWLDKVLIK